MQVKKQTQPSLLHKAIRINKLMAIIQKIPILNKKYSKAISKEQIQSTDKKIEFIMTFEFIVSSFIKNF